MSQNEIKQGFIVNGQLFATKEEATNFVRQPLIKAALQLLTGNNVELADWLIANQKDLQDSYSAGTVARVTKAERKELANAIKAAVAANIPGTQFLIDNASQVIDSFKWPTKARIKPEEKEVAIRAAFLDMTDGNAELVEWLIANKEAIDTAFEAGKTKREAPAGGQEALAQYRAEKAAATAAGPEALAAFNEKRRKMKEEKIAAEKAAKLAAKG